jgi:hypothetical protein
MRWMGEPVRSGGSYTAPDRHDAWSAVRGSLAGIGLGTLAAMCIMCVTSIASVSQTGRAARHGVLPVSAPRTAASSTVSIPL